MESTEAELKTTTIDLDNAQRDLAQQRTTTEQQATTLQVIISLSLRLNRYDKFQVSIYTCISMAAISLYRKENEEHRR